MDDEKLSFSLVVFCLNQHEFIRIQSRIFTNNVVAEFARQMFLNRTCPESYGSGFVLPDGHREE